MNDQLLIKHLLKETSEEETFLVEEWLKAHPDHQKKYKQMQWIWESSRTTLGKSNIDENLAWEKFKQRKAKTSRSFTLSPFWIRGVAAAIFILVLGGVVLSFLPHSGKAYFATVVLESQEDSKLETLLDGSQVTLNRNSRLSYSQKIFSGQRTAHLVQGEAYFEVQKNESKPFYIQVDDVTIRVLGTSFNVKKGEDHTAILLENGSVSVTLGDQSLTMQPGEKVSAQGKKLEKSQIENQLFKYYLNNKFEIQNIPLYQVIEALNNAYGSMITVASEDLQSRRLTTTLEYGSLDQNLEVIKETLGISISGKGKDKVLY